MAGIDAPRVASPYTSVMLPYKSDPTADDAAYEGTTRSCCSTWPSGCKESRCACLLAVDETFVAAVADCGRAPLGVARAGAPLPPPPLTDSRWRLLTERWPDEADDCMALGSCNGARRFAESSYWPVADALRCVCAYELDEDAPRRLPLTAAPFWDDDRGGAVGGIVLQSGPVAATAFRGDATELVM